MNTDAALQRAGVELAKASKQLELFRTQHKPREIEEKRIALDAQGNYADEAKDELAELEAMYKEDEFAKATKELVIKRSRRQMELADRRLAVARREFEVFEQHTLVEREDDLQRKVDDTKTDLEKAQIEQQKSKIELDVARRQAEDRVRDLERDIRDLEQELAKLGEGGS
jgi:guanylate kinase